MKNVLLYYSFSFALGGGEHLPLSLIASLQKMGNVTVALDQADNLKRSSEVFGIDIDLSALKVVQVTSPGYDPRRHGFRDSLCRFRNLRRLAKEADVCISTANIMDFGRPAHHFINMLAFGDDGFTAYAHRRVNGVQTADGGGARRFLVEHLLRPLLGMSSKRSIICDPSQRIYPNSHFVEKLMTDYYGPFNSRVFYPPTLFEEAPAAVERDPLKVVYIGRVIPEKRVAEIIGIVEKARAATGLDLRLEVAGRIDQVRSYGEQLRRMAAERKWLAFRGPLYGREKADILWSGSYAVHAERFEAFGISIAEYLKSGCIAIVPDDGGSREIVDSPELTYHTDAEAADILARLLADAPFRERQRLHCAARAENFTRKAYMERQQKLLEEIMNP